MSHTYTVDATRSGKWWVLEEPTLGCVSQVRHLGEVDEEMREAIAYQAGIAEADVRITTNIVLPETVARQVAVVEELREESKRANTAAANASRTLVTGLRDEGFTMSDIGLMLGITKGRVSQLAKAS